MAVCIQYFHKSCATFVKHGNNTKFNQYFITKSVPNKFLKEILIFSTSQLHMQERKWKTCVCTLSKSAFNVILVGFRQSRKQVILGHAFFVSCWRPVKFHFGVYLNDACHQGFNCPSDLVCTVLLAALCLDLVIEFTAPTLTFGFLHSQQRSCHRNYRIPDSSLFELTTCMRSSRIQCILVGSCLLLVFQINSKFISEVESNVYMCNSRYQTCSLINRIGALTKTIVQVQKNTLLQNSSFGYFTVKS